MTIPPEYFRQDHDQRFKVLFKEFVAELFGLFWPTYAALFDFASVEWLDLEAFPDPPLGKRKALDIVGKMPLREPIDVQPGVWSEQLLAVIHIEIESSDSVAPLRENMFKYYAWLNQKHALPVLPVAIYLNVGLNGIGEDEFTRDFGPLQVLRFRYLYAGLPGLDGPAFLESGTALGVSLSALMRIPDSDRPRHKAEALQRVIESGQNELREFLLSECIQTYLTLPQPEQQREFEQLLNTPDFEEVRQVATTWYEKGLEQGRLRLAIEALEAQFGVLAEPVRLRLNAWPEQRFLKLIQRLSTASSLDALLDDVEAD